MNSMAIHLWLNMLSEIMNKQVLNNLKMLNVLNSNRLIVQMQF